MLTPTGDGPPHPTPASRATWKDKGDNKPQRMFPAEQRAILVSKSVYLEHSCLEESLPLVEMGRGTRLDVGGESRWGVSGTYAVSAGTDTVSAEQGTLGYRGFPSSSQAPLPSEPNDTPPEGTCLQTVSLDALLLTGGNWPCLSDVLFHPTPCPWYPTTSNTPGHHSYSKLPTSYPTVSQNPIIYEPPFRTFDISRYH